MYLTSQRNLEQCASLTRTPSLDSTGYKRNEYSRGDLFAGPGNAPNARLFNVQQDEQRVLELEAIAESQKGTRHYQQSKKIARAARHNWRQKVLEAQNAGFMNPEKKIGKSSRTRALAEKIRSEQG